MKKDACTLLILILSLLYSQLMYAIVLDDNYEATYAGIEVIGADRATAKKIREQMPIKSGDHYVASDNDKYKSICNDHVKRITLRSDASCGTLLYGEGIAHLIIDIPMKEAKSVKFRTIPQKRSPVLALPKELVNVYDQWEQRRTTIASDGIFPKENFHDNYLDYDDPNLHDLAQHLSKLAWEHNEILLDLIHYSTDVEERRRAATLFSWCGHSENIARLLEWNVLLDPDQGVRNNIARSLMFAIPSITDQALLKDHLSVSCKLVSLPKFTDRNKALYSINTVLKSHPELATNINQECKNLISYISEESILPNIGGVAKEIVKQIREPEND